MRNSGAKRLRRLDPLTIIVSLNKFLIMDISAEKLNIIQRICEIQDKDLLELIQNIIELPQRSKADWWDKISSEEQSSIERGISDLKTAKTKSHVQVRERYEKYLND
jgi:hypothetical protein